MLTLMYESGIADVGSQSEIKALIMERFDKFAAERNAIPLTNGHSQQEHHPKDLKAEPKVTQPDPKVALKRKSESDKEGSEEDDQLSDVPVTPPPKKKRKPEVDEDAAFAARLQAEENSRARPTRGGAVRKPPLVKKKKTPKKKTSDKVKAEDDSDLEGSGSGSEKKVNRSGGFHVRKLVLCKTIASSVRLTTPKKPLVLSAPLSALCDGETQVSFTSASPHHPCAPEPYGLTNSCSSLARRP